MRSFTDIFIKHPVLAVVVNLVIILAGWRALTTLPVQQYPKIESSSVVITTIYYGASAETVRGFLSTPIERVVSAISGVDYVDSTSRAGVSTVTVHLKLNHNSTAALAEVTARLQQVRSELPADAEPPALEIQRADRPYASFYLSFSSTERSVPAVTDWLLRTLQPQLSTLSGIQRVTFEGGRQIAMRIWIDPDRLSSFNLSPGDVQAALRRNNFLAAVGRTKGNVVQLNLLANTDLRSAGEFEELIVADRGGAIVRLKDVAQVERGAEEAEMIAKYNKTEGVYLGVWPVPGANEIEVAQRLRDEMERIRPTLPKDIDMRLVWDGTMFMRNALTEITKTLSETILIVALVVFLFMGSVRTALVPLVAMPVSLVGAAIFMFAFGFSLNLLTLLAIVLSVGLVVDDAIVVVENVERHVRLGKSRIDAAIKGARELVGPIIAMTLTLATVYTPIAFQGGLTGALFREFALTLAGAVFISGVVALTLSPMMSAHLLRSEHVDHGFSGWVNRTFDRFRDWYGSHLDRTLNARPAVYLVWAGVSALALFMFVMIPKVASKELAPMEDQGVIFGIVTAPANATIDDTIRYADAAGKIFQDVPDTRFTFQITFPDNGFGGMVLKPWGVRKTPTAAYLPPVQQKLGAIPGIQMFPIMPSPLPGSDNFPVSFVIASTADQERILEFAQQIFGKAMQAHVFRFGDIDTKIDQPQAEIDFDHD